MNNYQKCQNCDGTLIPEEIKLEDYQGGKLYVMEKVSAYVCQSCGEVFIPEEILAEFENMITTTKKSHKSKKKK